MINIKDASRPLFIVMCLLSIVIMGAGCPPRQTFPSENLDGQAEQKMEESAAPDDGLDEALKELDIVDTESSGGWGTY